MGKPTKILIMQFRDVAALNKFVIYSTYTVLTLMLSICTWSFAVLNQTPLTNSMTITGRALERVSYILTTFLKKIQLANDLLH